jgi:hypothetical protein
VPAQALMPQTPTANSWVFRSAFDGYQPYSDEKISDWKDANDGVARIGGWRAYTKEANSTEVAPSAPVENRGAKP